MLPMIKILIILAALTLSGCVTNDYGAMVYETVPSVSGCPNSDSACSAGGAR